MTYQPIPHTPHSEHNTARQSNPLRLPETPRIVVLAGFAGSGKTTTLSRMVSGLGEDAQKAGVIINEIGGASTEVDLDQLKSDLAKRGIEGCACCASNQQVLDTIAAFRREGKKLVLIEQSGLSVTEEFASSIAAAGHAVHVISLINPKQIDEYGAYVIRHIRGADSILITHSSEQDLSAARTYIHDIRDDVSTRKVPVDLDTQFNAPFPAPIWERAISLEHSQLAGAERSYHDESRREAIRVFNEIEIVLWNNCSLNQVLDCVKNLTASNGKKVDVLRAKGVFNGKNLNITPEGQGKFAVSLTDRDFPSKLFGGRNFILVRALDPALRLCIPDAIRKIGMPDFSDQAMKAIGKLYPDRSWLERRFSNWLQTEPGSDKSLTLMPPTSFSGDSVLVELREALSLIRSVQDSDRQVQVGNGIQILLGKFLEARIALFEHSNNRHVQGRGDAAKYLVDLSYGTLRILGDTFLGSNSNGTGLCQRVPPFKQAAGRILSFKPSKLLIANLARMQSPAIESRLEPNSIDLDWMTRIAREGIQSGEVASVDVLAAVRHLDTLGDGGRLYSKALKLGLS
jgi:G3E family GTPase